MTRINPPSADVIEGYDLEVVVWRTHDETLARTVALPALAAHLRTYGCDEDAARASEILADLADVRREWAMKTPCSPRSCWDGGTHGWHYHPAKEGARRAVPVTVLRPARAVATR